MVFAHLDQKVTRLWVLFQAFGAQIQCGAQILERFAGVAKDNFYGRQIVPGFRLIRVNDDKSFQRALKFG